MFRVHIPWFTNLFRPSGLQLMEISLSEELAPLATYCAPLERKNNYKEQLRERLTDGKFPISIGLWRAFDNFSVHLPG